MNLKNRRENIKEKKKTLQLGQIPPIRPTTTPDLRMAQLLSPARPTLLRADIGGPLVSSRSYPSVVRRVHCLDEIRGDDRRNDHLESYWPS